LGGFAKVDNRFGYEKWLQGGSIGFEFARGKTKGFIKTKSLGWWVGGWVGGFAKVDNGFG
jgi:hypothetical protein